MAAPCFEQIGMLCTCGKGQHKKPRASVTGNFASLGSWQLRYWLHHAASNRLFGCAKASASIS